MEIINEIKHIADHEVRIEKLEDEVENQRELMFDRHFNMSVWLMILSGVVSGILIGTVIKCF